MQNEVSELRERLEKELNKNSQFKESEKSNLNSRLREIKSSFEQEKSQMSERLFVLEKEKMQWHIEKQIMASNKLELEEKYNQLFSKLNNQQKELESLKKPPTLAKGKESTKNAIKDLMQRNSSSVLNRNILQNKQHANGSNVNLNSTANSSSSVHIPLSLRKCNSNGFLGGITINSN